MNTFNLPRRIVVIDGSASSIKNIDRDIQIVQLIIAMARVVAAIGYRSRSELLRLKASTSSIR